MTATTPHPTHLCLQRAGAIVLMLTLAGAGAACSDDGDGADEEASTTTEEIEAAPIEVEALDFTYDGLPDEIDAGTRLTLTNSSTTELHELVAFLLPETEQRLANELMALPPAELDELIGQGPPHTVLLAPPGGGAQIAAVGDGTFTEPGRYLVFCAIPTGADPEEYLSAPLGDGPPDVEGGPPHFTAGMYADLLVNP